MAPLTIPGFDRVGFGFALRNFIGTEVIPQAIKGIAVIALSFGRIIHRLLDGCLDPLPDHTKPQITTGHPAYDSDDADLVFSIR
jgi:hypothetical protein